jgi:thiol peroxidase
LKGNKLSLEGPELKKGDRAPDATLRRSLVEKTRIGDTQGKTRIFSVVPSLDTPVCAMQTKRFNEEVGKLANVDFFTISCDLPTAQGRFCGAENINTELFKFLSDYYDTGFGKAYGTLIPDLRIECRAVFVLDPSGTIQYAEYVPEVASQPNYDAVLACAKQVAG